MTFEPARRRRTKERPPRGPIEWGIIYRAVVVVFAATFVLGAACGILARFLGVSLSKAAAAGLMQSAWPYVVGFLIGLVPLVIGSIYLADRLERDEKRHCLILGVIDLAASLVFKAGFSREPTSFWEVVYYLSIIPTTVAIGWWYSRERA